jgi:restriction endonuclease Mrr
MEVNSKFKFKERYPEAESVKPYKGRKLKLDVRGRHTILLGVESIDLLQVEQLMDTSQTRAIAYAINHAQTYMDGKHSMNDVMGMIERDIDRNGLDVLAPSGRRYPHNLARPRIFEFIAALNRLRTFKTLSK